MSEDLNKLRELAEAATPGPWHHCQPFMVVPAQKTVHGTVPAERVDYVSTWPDRGTPPGHRVVVPMPPECGPGVRSADMAFIAAFNPATALSLIARLQAAEERAEKVREDLALTAALARELFKRDRLIVESDKLVFTGPWARVGFVSVSEILDRADAALKTGA